MAVIYSTSSISVGTAGEDLNVSNSGWTKNTSSGAYSTSAVLVTDANAPPNGAYAGGATTAGYLRDEVPGSTTQTVKLTLRRIGSLAAEIWTVQARATSGGDDYVSCNFQTDSSQVALVKCINGTRTTIMSGVSVAGLTSVGTEKVLEIRVSGVSPSISVSAYWDGSQVGSTQTVTDSQIDGVGRVGFAHRNAAATSSTGAHVVAFYAEDDTSSTTPIGFSGTIPTQTFADGDSVDVDLSGYFDGTETPFSYSSVGASFAALGLSINSSTGHLTGTAAEGSVSGCQIRGTDATPDTADSNTFTITVTAANSAPSWSGTPSAMSAKRGQALTPQDITSLVSDADLDTLSYSITGAPTGVTINSSTGVISGTPTAAPGVYACTVEADDGIASPVSSSSFNITVTQCVLALNSAGYEFGDGNDPATMSVVASTDLQVAAYPLTEWPPASAIATATATTGTNGRLADLGDDDLSFGTTYRVIARNAADGETWAWTMAAS